MAYHRSIILKAGKVFVSIPSWIRSFRSLKSGRYVRSIKIIQIPSQSKNPIDTFTIWKSGRNVCGIKIVYRPLQRENQTETFAVWKSYKKKLDKWENLLILCRQALVIETTFLIESIDTIGIIETQGKKKGNEMEKQKNYWIDYNLNRWDDNKYDEAEAEKLSNSLHDCMYCYNCKDCKGCHACIDCETCKDCTDCRNCRDCSHCTDCLDCSNIDHKINFKKNKWTERCIFWKEKKDN